MSTAAGTQQVYGQEYGGSAPENYERYFVPVIPGPLARDLVGRARLRPGERVLDVACGTGVVARLAAERVAPGGSVAGLDVNAAMLSVARTATAAAPLTIRWYESTAEAMPFPDGSFDVALCQLGLQFIPDRPAAVRELHRVLAPGGRVLISTPGPSPLFDALHDLVRRYVSEEAATFMGMVFSLHDVGELRQLLAAAGFEAIEVSAEIRELRLPDPASFLWQYLSCTPIADAVSAMPSSRRAQMEREARERWQPWVRDGVVIQPQPMTISSARKLA
jgi:ubiquinone/menaquinone biosynthesis C-methylase UbiE